MADISEIDAAQAVKIIGSETDGTEQSPIGSTGDRLKTQPLDNKGATTAYSGTATTTVANIPTVAGQPISQCLIRTFSNDFEVSFDGGTSYLELNKNDAFTWDVKGEPTQLKIRTTTGTADYRILLNTEEA